MGIFDFFKKNNTEEAPDRDLKAESSNSSTGNEEQRPESLPQEENITESEIQEEAQPVREEAAGKTGKLTPEQVAERKAKQEELTKKRDEEGKILAYLIDRHHELKSADSFKTVLQSLTTSWLWIPMNMQISKSDAAAMQAARQTGGKVKPKDPVRLGPALLKLKDGQLIYSSFSNREEIPKEMQKKFIWVQMPSGQCAQYVVANKNIGGLVINPNSKSLLLKRELLEKIVQPVQKPDQQKVQEMAAEPDTTGYTS